MIMITMIIIVIITIRSRCRWGGRKLSRRLCSLRKLRNTYKTVALITVSTQKIETKKTWKIFQCCPKGSRFKQQETYNKNENNKHKKQEIHKIQNKTKLTERCLVPPGRCLAVTFMPCPCPRKFMVQGCTADGCNMRCV